VLQTVRTIDDAASCFAATGEGCRGLKCALALPGLEMAQSKGEGSSMSLNALVPKGQSFSRTRDCLVNLPIRPITRPGHPLVSRPLTFVFSYY
jgi:hypothetical protein